MVYLITRAISIFAGLGWLTLNPVGREISTPLYYLFILIVLYSLASYTYFFFYKKHKLHYVYIFLLPLDVIVLSSITFLTGGPESPFFYGFYLLVILPAFYYGLWAGLVSALAISFVDSSISFYFYQNFAEIIDKSIFRLGFYWILAIAGGLLANKYFEEKKILEKTSQSLEHKVSAMNLLFDISHSLLFQLDLDHRKQTFSETLKRAFHLTSFAVFLIDNNKRKAFFKFGYNPEKVNLSLVLKALKEKETFQEFHKKSHQRKLFYQDSLAFFPLLIKESTTGFLICLKEDLKYLSLDEIESLSLFASLAGVSFDNAFLHQKIKSSSITDDLTGLYNHRLLKSQLEKEINRAQRSGKPLSIILLDLDNFKECNDSFGHLEGDAILRKIGNLLKKNTRASDFPTRYGGDEFAIICPNTSLEEAVFVAKKLQNTIANYPFKTRNQRQTFKITISAGVSTFPAYANNLKDLLLTADSALFKAKSKGSSKLEIANPRQ